MKMAADGGQKDFLRAVLDANPDFMFVVDEDVRIIEFNRAAGQFLSVGRDQVLRRRGGDVLHCLHSTETPDGCGRAPYCQTCVVRNSVKEAFQGQAVVRRKNRLELVSAGNKKRIHVSITASPFRYEEKQLALLVIEDISELEEIRRIIPICAKCKKIRDDEQYWAELEAYFKEHMDLDFTHGLCPQCFQEFMGEIREYGAKKSGEESR
jgi:nitrogen fixation/metabolism regulation signal transduction histidine kinase